MSSIDEKVDTVDSGYIDQHHSNGLATDLERLKLNDQNNSSPAMSFQVYEQCSDQQLDVVQSSHTFFIPSNEPTIKSAFCPYQTAALSTFNAKAQNDNSSYCYQSYSLQQQIASLEAMQASCLALKPQVVETAACDTRFKHKYPATVNEWLACASKPVSEDNPSLVMWLDLDRSVLTNSTPEGRINCVLPSLSEVHVMNNGQSRPVTLYIDDRAFEQLRNFSERKHIIHVITSNTYIFADISKLFRHYGIELTSEHFHDRDTMYRYVAIEHGVDTELLDSWDFSCLRRALDFNKGFDFRKYKYFEQFQFFERALLYDDDAGHRSEFSHFIHADPQKPFPNLEEGKIS